MFGVRIFEIPTCRLLPLAWDSSKCLKRPCLKKWFGSFCSSWSHRRCPSRTMVFFWVISGGISQGQNFGPRVLCWFMGIFFGREFADRKGIRKSLFDLPAFQPAGRSIWYQIDFMYPNGHQIHQAVLKMTRLSRSLNASGVPAFSNLTSFAAGSVGK